RPYASRSFAEFWTRWHISLSTWLRTYLYIPLGGNRHGRVRTYLNLMIVMGLGGLWHGAGLGYLAWGLLHGALLVMERPLLPALERWSNIVLLGGGVALLSQLFVFGCVSFSWVFFKLPDLHHAIDFAAGMFSDRSVGDGPHMFRSLAFI